MREPALPFSTVPFGADQTIYLVVDHLGERGAADREHNIERPDLENVLADLLGGRFHDPIRVVAFNTLEHWSRDISTDVAREILSRCDSDGLGPPQYLAGFMEMHLDRVAGSGQRPSRAR
jgi:hypothetical protein